MGSEVERPFVDGAVLGVDVGAARACGVVGLPLPLHAPAPFVDNCRGVLGRWLGQAVASARADDRVPVPGEPYTLVGDAVDRPHVCLRRIELDVGRLGDVAGAQLGAGLRASRSPGRKQEPVEPCHRGGGGGR